MKYFSLPLVLMTAPFLIIETSAATFTVTSNADDGAPGTLRAAINSLNASSDASNTIQFAGGLSGQTIMLASDLPAIKKPVLIDGTGVVYPVTISGAEYESRVFFVDSADVEITFFKVSGVAKGGDGGNGGTGGGGGGGAMGAGGAVYVTSQGAVTLTNIEFLDCQAIGGDGGDGGTHSGNAGSGGGGGGGFSQNGANGAPLVDPNNFGGGGGGGGGGCDLVATTASPAGAGSGASGEFQGVAGGDGANHSGSGGAAPAASSSGGTVYDGNPGLYLSSSVPTDAADRGQGGGGGSGGSGNGAHEGADGGAGGNATAYAGGGGGGGGSGQSGFEGSGIGGAGGAGGLGGGGGGSGMSNQGSGSGGDGGFGAGGGGSGGTVSGGTTGFGGGSGGTGSLAGSGGGGGGMGAGGAIFVERGGTVTIGGQEGLFVYSSNSAQGGTGGTAGVGGGTAGSSGGNYGQEIFVMSGGNLIFDVATGGDVTVTSAIESDNLIEGNGLIKKGAGTLQLFSPNNTYTGDTLIQGGILEISGNGSLGSSGSSSNLIFSDGGGTLLILNNTNLARQIQIAQASDQAIFDADGSNVQLSGSITGDGSLVLQHGGNFYLSGSANTFSGDVTIDQTTLTLGASQTEAILGTGNLVTLSNGGVLANGGTFTLTKQLAVSGSSNTLSLGVNTFNLNGVVSGSGELRKSGTGSLNIGNTDAVNTFTGSFLVQSGTINVGKPSALGSGTATFEANTVLRSVYQFDPDEGIPADFVLNGLLTIDSNGFIMALNGDISGAGSITKTNTGELYLNGANTSAGLLVSEGSVNIAHSAALSSAATFSDDTGLGFNADLQGVNAVQTAITLSGSTNGIEFNTGGFDADLEGDITGTGPLYKTNGGLLNLSGNNTFSGGLIVQAGRVGVGSSTGLGAGSVTFSTGTTLQATGTVSLSNALIASGNMTIDTNGQTLTLAANPQLSGAGNITKISAGNLVINGANTAFTGDMTLNQGTLTIGNSDALGSGTLNLNEGTALTSSLIIDLDLTEIVLTGTSSGIDFSSDFTVGIHNGISGTGPLNKTGTGTLWLLGDNTFTEGFHVESGIVELGSNTALGVDTATFQDGSSLRAVFQATNILTPIAIDGSVDFLTNGFAIAFNAPFSGSGTLTKSTTGTLSLNAANSFLGEIIVEEGSFALGHANVLDSTVDLTLFDDSNLTVTTNIDLENAIELYGSGNGVNINSIGFTLGLEGAITGTGSINKIGSGTLSLSGNNSFNGLVVESGIIGLGGNTALGSGDVQFQNNTQLKAIASTTNVANAIEVLGSVIWNTNSLNITLSGDVTGSGSITKSSAGTLYLTGDNDFSGGLSVQQGTVGVGSYTALGTATAAFADGTAIQVAQDLGGYSIETPIQLSGTVSFDTNSFEMAIEEEISGTGSLEKISSGELKLLAVNDFSGDLSVQAGSVVVEGYGELPSGVNVLIASGATLDLEQGLTQTIGNLTGAGQVALDSVDLTLETAGSQVFSGQISGSSFLYHDGSGRLSLTGNNTNFVGELAITQGDVRINNLFGGDVSVESNGTLGGSGTVEGNVTGSGGIIAPGNSIGTLTILGDYTQSADTTLNIEVGSNEAIDLLAISGTATLNGILNVGPVTGSHIAGVNYTFLTADGGITGAWSEDNLGSLAVDFRLSIGANSAFLICLNTNVFSDQQIIGYNPNQVADYLEKNVGAESTELINFIYQLDTLNSQNLSDALDRMHPAQMSAIVLSQESLNAQLQSLLAAHEPDCCCEEGICSDFIGNRIWIQPFGNWTGIGPKQQLKRSEAVSGGFAIGNEYSWDNLSTIGVALGFDSVTLHWEEHFGKAEMNNVFAGVYFDYRYDQFQFNGSVRGGLDFIDQKRYIDFLTTALTAKSSYSAYELAVHIGADWSLPYKSGCFKPYLAVDAFAYFQNGFTESGAEVFNLNVNHKNSAYIRTQTGLILTRDLYWIQNIKWCPELFVGYTNIAPITSRTYQSGFEGLPDSLTVHGYNKIWSLFSTGLGLKGQHDRGAGFGVNYRLDVGDHYLSNEITLDLSIQF